MSAPPAPYERVGGDAIVRALVSRFYDLMDSDSQYAGIRGLHPADLAPAREKLYLFLSGWLGGPQLYAAKYGHPMLRARHLHAAIGIAERDQWLACMSRAMADVEIEEGLRRELYNAFYKTADWMRNREG
ncbi:MAG TPA: group II truncated hemoglobin [Burkholderiales bacterium]